MAAKAKRAAGGVQRVSGIESASDRREAMETLARAFSSPQWMEAHLDRGLWAGATFDSRHTRIAVAGNRVVAAVVLGPREVRFGPVTVPAMTVGPVGTHDKFRKHGYGAAAMHDASAYMKDNGYLLAYLQGIRDFYYRFGYYAFTAPCAAKIPRKDAEKQAAAGRLRAMTRRDLPAVRRLYDRVTAGRTLVAARDNKVWDWLMGPAGRTWMFHKPRVILDGRGRLCGYLTTHPKGDFTISEVLVLPDQAACRAALGALCREAKRREVKELVLRLPWDDGLALFLRQYVGAEFTMRSNPTGGALLKIVDFPALMRRLQPLFAQRWRQARPTVKDLRFTLACEIGAVGFEISRGVLRVGASMRGPRALVPQRWLSGLLSGYYTPHQVAVSKGARIPPSVLGVMEILFPAGWPFVHQGDNY